jgi:ribosome maturation factor RimP
MTLTPEIQKHILSIIEMVNPECFVVEMRLKKSGQSILLIRVDTDAGIQLEECMKISRAVGKWLEESDPFQFNYTLEVTSPGVGEPLLLKRQYKKEVGRRLRVILKDVAVVEGTLQAANDENIILSLDPPKKKKKPEDPPIDLEKSIPYDAIKEAKVVIMF